VSRIEQAITELAELKKLHGEEYQRLALRVRDVLDG
jgi:hypothetical protein